MRDSPDSISVGCQVSLANSEPSPGPGVYTQVSNGTKGRALFVISCPKIHCDISDFFKKVHMVLSCSTFTCHDYLFLYQVNYNEIWDELESQLNRRKTSEKLSFAQTFRRYCYVNELCWTVYTFCVWFVFICFYHFYPNVSFDFVVLFQAAGKMPRRLQMEIWHLHAMFIDKCCPFQPNEWVNP